MPRPSVPYSDAAPSQPPTTNWQPLPPETAASVDLILPPLNWLLSMQINFHLVIFPWGVSSQLSMEVLISAVAGDLISRFISFLAQSYGSQTCEEDDRRRLESLFRRIQTVVEEAEGRHITNRGMFLQLKALIEGVYLGYYMIDKLKLESLGEERIDDDEVSTCANR